MAKTDDIFSSPQAAQILKNKEQLMGMVNSPDAKRLMQMLQKSGGTALQGAADAAMKGDPSQLMDMVKKVMSTPDGAAAIQNINRHISK